MPFVQRFRQSLLLAFYVAITLPVLWVIAVIVLSLFEWNNEHLPHLLQFVVPRTAFNTLRLAIFVLLFAGFFGVLGAWLTTRYRFPGSKLFSWALFLPMAMPGYVLAFAFSGVHENLISMLYEAGISTGWVPPLNNFLLVSLALSLVLYPYVYLLSRGAFLTQSKTGAEVAATLGYSEAEILRKVALPSARPWIVAGLLLVLMETLADFGTVAVFNYQTFTTAIYKSWFDLYSITTALQLSALLLLAVLAVVFFERRSRLHQRFDQKSAGFDNYSVKPQLKGCRALLAMSFCTALLLLAFVLPVTQLVIWGMGALASEQLSEYPGLLIDTLQLGAYAVLAVVGIALVFALANRFSRFRYRQAFSGMALMGYAMPGTLLAVALFAGAAALARAMESAGFSVPWLQGSIVIMLIAYGARFLAVALQPLESNLQRVTQNIDWAAQSLGASMIEAARRLHIPMIRAGLYSAILLVFVDVVKELPITLMTRPYGVDTLAIKIYEYSAEGLWERAALPALTLVFIGLIPVYLLISSISKESARKVRDGKV